VESAADEERGSNDEGDMPTALSNVCFRGQSGHRSDLAQCPPQSGHYYSKRAPFVRVTLYITLEG